MFSRNDLSPLTELDHIKQSILDIITTPIGSRLMNRTYGCGLFALLDRPMNQETHLELVVACGEAIEQWEQRVSVKQLTVNLAKITNGVVEIAVEFVLKATGQTVQTTIGGAV